MTKTLFKSMGIAVFVAISLISHAVYYVAGGWGLLGLLPSILLACAAGILSGTVFLSLGYWSDRISLYMTNAKLLTTEPLVDKTATRFASLNGELVEENHKLQLAVTVLAQRLGLPAPRVAIMPTQNINAMASGWSSRNGLIVLTEGMLRTMDNQSIKAAVAHELCHIKHKDIKLYTWFGALLLTLVVFGSHLFATMLISATLYLPAQTFAFGHFSYGIIYLLSAIIFSAIAWLVFASVSRGRELKADRFASKLVGKRQMIQLFETLALPSGSNRVNYTAASLSEEQSLLDSNLQLHPPLSYRIHYLQSLS